MVAAILIAEWLSSYKPLEKPRQRHKDTKMHKDLPWKLRASCAFVALCLRGFAFQTASMALHEHSACAADWRQ
jgi:hypothetical protein